jgi:hypothetical protein
VRFIFFEPDISSAEKQKLAASRGKKPVRKKK